MDALELRLFGPPRLLAGGRPVATGLRRGLALLAYLAVTGRPHGRERLAALVWPEEDAATARGRLRRTLHELNRQAGLTLAAGDGETVALADGVPLAVDVARFRAALAAGGADALEAAADIQADEFMAGFALEGAAGFMDWLGFTREALRHELAGALDRLSALREAAGELDRAVAATRRQLALDPLQEPVHCRLMRLHAAAGQPAAALRQYEALVRLLDEELGVEPRPETVAAFRAIAGGPAAARPGPASPAERPETRYTRSGGAVLAYQVLGGGPVDLVLVPGFVSHLEIGWQNPDLAAFLHRLAGGARVILFDRRGLGLSERLATDATPEHLIEDLDAVLDAAGSRRAVLLGCSEGGPGSALYAARRPERVEGLVLYGALAKGSRAEGYEHALTPAQYELWIADLAAGWGGAPNLEVFAPSRAHDEALRRWFADLLRHGATPAGLRGTLTALRDADVRPVLDRIAAPVLVLHRTGDRAVRVAAGRDLAARIPGARLVELPGEDHWWWIGDTRPILEAVEGFLEGLAGAAAPPRLAAVLALDPPDAMRAEAVLLATGHGGRVAPAPRGGPLLAAFDSLAAALAAGRALAAAIGGARAGLDLGDCREGGGMLEGRAVSGARAAMEAAAPGELRLSPAARAACP